MVGFFGWTSWGTVKWGSRDERVRIYKWQNSGIYVFVDPRDDTATNDMDAIATFMMDIRDRANE